MAVNAPVEIDRTRIRELTEREGAKLDERTGGSKAMYERARRSLSGGVASSYQVREPWPIYLTHGKDERVWDVDGSEYLDFHNGFGSMTQGHAHPVITRAIAERAALGTHFAAATEDGIAVAEELARRFRLPKWRYTNSGSEATMDAIRIARAHTGRDVVLKIFGSYHGHHDTVMVSIGVDLTVPVPFNDAAAMERRIERLAAEGRLPACLIMEAAMMNLGVVLPEPGYLEAVRELTSKHGIVLIFDEVKTGLTVAAGGAVEHFGVVPDLVTLAKTLGAGLPSGAIGGTEEVMACVEDGSVFQVGTFNGNPLTMAAARASLYDVLTPEAYEHLHHLNERLLEGCGAVVEQYRLPGYAVGIGSNARQRSSRASYFRVPVGFIQ